MEDETGLEDEVKEHFKRKSIMRAEHKGQSRIYMLMMMNKYGALVSGPPLRVDWKRVFAENQCPQCKDLMSLTEDRYVSPKCKLSIPLGLYDKAVDEYKTEIRLSEEDKRITQKIKEAGLSEDKILTLYNKAEEEAQAEMEMKRRQEEASEQAKTGVDNSGKPPKT